MKKISIILAIAATLAACSKTDSFNDPTPYSLATSSKLAGKIVSGAPDCFGHIKSDKVTNLAQGVELLDLAYLNKTGYAMRLYMYKVVLGGADIKVVMPENGGNLGKIQPLSEQTAAMNATDMVLGSVNGDSYSASNLYPAGIVYRDGNALKTSFTDAKGGFFATLKDGSAIVAESSSYSTYRLSIMNAIGTKSRILDGGYPSPQSDAKAAARSFVGVSEDGMTVFLGVVDGVYFYYSNGITVSDLASILKAAGAHNAALLDSGACTTLVARDDFGEKLFYVKNTPSNNGIEESVVNGLAIIQK